MLFARSVRQHPVAVQTVIGARDATAHLLLLGCLAERVACELFFGAKFS